MQSLLFLEQMGHTRALQTTVRLFLLPFSRQLQTSPRIQAQALILLVGLQTPWVTFGIAVAVLFDDQVFVAPLE